MKQVKLTVRSNTEIAGQTWCMVLEGDVGAVTRPGQFINIRIGSRFLRRPISVCDMDTLQTGAKRIEKEAAEAFGASLYNDPVTGYTAGERSAGIQGSLTILYRIAGGGTLELSRRRRDDVLDVLTGLGNGFDIRLAGDAPLLIGGGIGSAPLMMLAKHLISDGVRPTAVLGFRSASDMILHGGLYEIGCDVYTATEDGSAGTRGFVTDLIRDLKDRGACFSHFYACGPSPMLRAVFDATAGMEGQFSFEERMGCGFGACMGCTMETKAGPKRVCREGPVFFRSELLRE